MNFQARLNYFDGFAGHFISRIPIAIEHVVSLGRKFGVVRGVQILQERRVDTVLASTRTTRYAIRTRAWLSSQIDRLLSPGSMSAPNLLDGNVSRCQKIESRALCWFERYVRKNCGACWGSFDYKHGQSRCFGACRFQATAHRRDRNFRACARRDGLHRKSPQGRACFGGGRAYRICAWRPVVAVVCATQMLGPALYGFRDDMDVSETFLEVEEECRFSTPYITLDPDNQSGWPHIVVIHQWNASLYVFRFPKKTTDDSR